MFKSLSCDFDISRNDVSRLITLRIKVLNTAVKNRLNNSMIALLLEMRSVSPQNSTKFSLIVMFILYIRIDVISTASSPLLSDTLTAEAGRKWEMLNFASPLAIRGGGGGRGLQINSRSLSCEILTR